jgi:type I restriction enzyme, S subunit
VKANEVEKYRLVPGDLLMTEGGDIDKLGRAALWMGEIDVCLHQNHIFKVRCNKAAVIPEYLRALVGSRYGKGYFLKVAKRTTGIASINKTQLSGLPVLLPSISDQMAFADRTVEAESIQAQNAASLQVAEDMFQSLLHRAFAGGT